MNNIVNFSNVRENISELLHKEELRLNEDFKQELFTFLSKICSYQEEEVKIRPHLLVCKNIEEIIQQVPNTEFVKLNSGEIDGSDMKKILKSIVPFCNNGWLVYLNIFEDSIEYGIIRSFNGVTSLPFIESIKEIKLEDLPFLNYAFIEISVLSDYEVQINGLKSTSLTIDFRIHEEDNTPHIEIVRSLVTDVIKDISIKDFVNEFGNQDYDIERILSNSFSNFLRLLSQKVHGTILLVVNERFVKIPLVEDGVWLEKPINLAKYAIAAEMEKNRTNSNEVFYAFSSLLIDMLNIDGITVINSKGEIIGYNVFLSKSSSEFVKITSGGARRRAAQALKEEKNENFVGVYFQSQDGYASYERME